MQHRGSSVSRATADSHIARSKEVAMRWKCHGNVSTEMCFDLGKRSCRGGPNESMVLYATRLNELVMGNNQGMKIHNTLKIHNAEKYLMQIEIIYTGSAEAVLTSYIYIFPPPF